MRTTLSIDDDVLAAARLLAEKDGLSLGAAISQLARRGLQPAAGARACGFPIVEAARGRRTITPGDVQTALDEP